jgi:hypothetical protein
LNRKSAPPPARLIATTRQHEAASSSSDIRQPIVPEELGAEIQRAFRAKPDRRGERQKNAANKARRIAAADADALASREDEREIASDTGGPKRPNDAQSIDDPLAKVARVTESVSTSSSRAGERQRQADKRRVKAEAEAAEAARRRILNEQAANTPAAKALARMRERIIAKQLQS